MRRSLLSIFVLALHVLAFAQSHSLPDVSHVDQHVDSLALDHLDAAARTAMLVAPFSEEIERVRAIYRHVIKAIDYDHAAYRDGRRRINRNNDDVLRRNRAVCWGYSELIRSMCEASGINCHTVSGYARDSFAPQSAYEKANHAWNAVQIDGLWYLLDATWGSGLLSGDTYFSITDGIDYFLSSPELFIHSHFPLMSMWQLLSCPVKYSEFLPAQFPLQQESCSYNFASRIEQFGGLNFYDQQIMIMREAYDINPTQTNKKQIGHALVDVAIQHKELGDEYLESDSVELAVEELEAATRIFDLARHYCHFYPWQNVAMVYSYANLAQALNRGEMAGFRPDGSAKIVCWQLKELLEEKDFDIRSQIRKQLIEMVEGCVEERGK